MVCRSVGHHCEPCITGAIWDVDSGGPNEPCIRWKSRFAHVTGQFWTLKWAGSGHTRTCPAVDILKATQQGRALVNSNWLYQMGCTLAQPGKYDWTVSVQWRCSLTSNYFNHLFSGLAPGWSRLTKTEPSQMTVTGFYRPDAFQSTVAMQWSIDANQEKSTIRPCPFLTH